MKIGDFIKVHCEGGFIESGKIYEYTNDKLILDQVDGSQVIIINPNKNIIIIRAQNNTSKTIESKLQSNYNSHELNFLTKAELKKLAAHEERKKVKDLLLSQEINTFKEVEFGLPDYSKPIPQHTTQEIKRRLRRHRKGALE